MKSNQYITSVEDLISTTESLVRDSSDFILFRGQSCNEPLIPKVARANPKKDTASIEEKMIMEFRRRLARETDIAAMDDWDIMVYAQHHGLKTRLLDWTTNPLFALWFACSDYESSSEGYIFLFIAKAETLLDASKEPNPFKIKKTYVVRPPLCQDSCRL